MSMKHKLNMMWEILGSSEKSRGSLNKKISKSNEKKTGTTKIFWKNRTKFAKKQ